MNSERTARLKQRVATHAALADFTRLQIVDLLAVGDLAASELGEALSVPSNLLAHHLKVLEEAGLVTRRRSEGDRRRMYLSLVRDEQSHGGSGPLVEARRVVFVCTANTARSHLAAALWREASRTSVVSAGTHPGERIAPGAVNVARRHGLHLPDIAPRDMTRLLRPGDLVITVCDRAHEELGDLGWAHWSVPDPVPRGTMDAFDAAYLELAARVDAVAPTVASAS